MEAMTIGKLAKKVGIGVETVRFYERKGLISKPRSSSSGFRKYQPEVADRLFFIKSAKTLGFSLKEIKDLLSLRASTKEKCSSVKAKAVAKITEVERKIADLLHIKSALETLISTCSENMPTSDCPILDALNQRRTP